MTESETKDRFFHVDISFTEEAFVRCKADNEDQAAEKAKEYLAQQGLKNVEIVKIAEVDSLYPGMNLDAGVPTDNEDVDVVPPNRTIN